MQQAPTWHKPSNLPILANNQAHIWRANLDLPAAEIERLTTILSPDEIVRANKFKFTLGIKKDLLLLEAF